MLFFFIDIDERILLSELAKVQTKWFEIGIQLGIKRNKLETFKCDHPSTSRCLMATVSYWLDGNTNIPVSWKSVVTVLNDPFVDESGIAKQIQEKYCPEKGIMLLYTQSFTVGRKKKFPFHPCRTGVERLDCCSFYTATCAFNFLHR